MLTADHRARLRRSLDSFIEEDTPRARKLRRVAKQLAILPITDDSDRHFGIRLSDGKVVSFNGNEPFDLQVVVLPNAQLAVLGRAWTEFPELALLVPARPADAIDCPACGGSGLIRHGDSPAGFSCYCGGLGWLFSDGWLART
jgi:hypothetical protein